MRILFEITHPKHAHLFKNAITELRKAGHVIKITSRVKDVTTALLDSWKNDIGDHEILSEHQRSGFIGLAFELIQRDRRLIQVCRKFKPDLLVARVGPSAAHAGKLLGIPVIVFEDTDDARLQQIISFPFATHVCTSSHYKKEWGRKHLRYNSFDEMAYLHTSRFTPDRTVVEQAGLIPGNYIVVRFVSWKASHDLHQKGVETMDKAPVIDELAKLGQVVISSEQSLPASLEKYRPTIPASKFHDLLAFAALSFGESSTVATEAAMLGVPGILVNTMHWSSIDRLCSEFKLLHQTHDVYEGLRVARSWLKDTSYEQQFQEGRNKLSQCQDLTDWMINLIQQFDPSQQM